MSGEKKASLEVLQAQVGTNVAFTAFMTAVVVFFNGLLITNFNTYDVLIKIPISFLMISIFGFLYATLILANSSEEVSKGDVVSFKKHLKLGDILSEYLGVYLLVLSIPLVINVITTDWFLRIITFASSVGGLILYQFSEFNLMERHFRHHRTISVMVILFAFGLFISQVLEKYFIVIAMLFILFMLSVAYFASRHKEKLMKV